ncbi:MAG TPA: protein kinase [Alphaproteobacteria bacterium]|nr:protein kinase [Alphaproteobacteria bacterium]
MAEPKKCSRCGAELPSGSPGGHCPQCLLNFGLTAGMELDEPAAGENVAPPSEIPANEKPGDRIGHYQLIRQIGEGGMGAVWLAGQLEPVRRQVALKIVKLGLDTKRMVARFEAERQALALMDHPNIAKVLDAGATETGRPYFVMELVAGTKITEFCDNHLLPVPERLKLFIQVCRAIQHAHQKGIIHRDLKPSNILVAEDGGVPTPKVIDFGIAKATAGIELTDKTLFTAFEQFLGTPAYMSPEQASLGRMDIDTRSDIYSLGVLLYELLGGWPPFDEAGLKRAALDEILQTIRKKDPPRPSTRLAMLAAHELAVVAQCRQSEPGRLPNSIRGDLDWIVMKALEKDRDRRYETANGLAADIQRHLSREPVLARPPSQIYRLQKAVQRNKLAFAAAASVAVALVAGLAVSSWLYFSESRARVRAMAAERAESAQRQRAEASEQAVQRSLYDAKMSLAQQEWEQNDLAGLRRLLAETATSPARGFEWYFWQRQTHLELQTLRGHLGSVVDVAFFPDGRRVLTASADGTAKIWNAASGEELMTLAGHRDRLICACVSPDGRRIVTCSRDRTARVWDADTGRELLTIKGHDGWVTAAAFAPDGQRIVTCDVHGNAIIWRPSSGQELFRFRDVTGFTKVVWSKDGQRLVTCGYDKTVKIWNAADGKVMSSLAGHRDRAPGVAFTPDGRDIITASLDGTAKVWDGSNGTELLTLQDSKGLNSVAVSPDGRWIVTSGENRTAEFWDPESGTELFVLKGHEDFVFTVAFSPDGRQLITGSGDGTAKIWESDEKEPLRLGPMQHLVESDERIFSSAAFSPDGRRIVMGAIVGSDAKLFDSTTGEPLQTLPGDGAWINSLAFSPDGRWIAVAAADRVARLWNIASGKFLGTLRGHHSQITAVAFSPDCRRIVTASDDCTAKIWDVASGKELLTLNGHSAAVNCVAYSPKGDRLFTGSDDGTIRVWDGSSSRALLDIEANEGIEALACSGDGLRLVTGGADGMACVWDAITGRQLLKVQGDKTALSSVGFSPDGQRFVTASDAVAKVWDAANGEELLSLPGPAHWAAFSPNGQQLLVGNAIWSAASATQISAWQEKARAVAARLEAIQRENEVAIQKANALRAQDPGAIKQWLVLAPIPIGSHDAIPALDRAELADEAYLCPRAGDKARLGASELIWTEQRLPNYILDFNEVAGKVSEWSVAYAVCYIQSQSVRSNLVIQVGSDDESKIYLNGRQIYRWGELRQFRPDEDLVDEGVSLKAGCNVLVFKVVNETAGWAGSIWLTDSSGQPVKGISVSLTPPAGRE